MSDKKDKGYTPFKGLEDETKIYEKRTRFQGKKRKRGGGVFFTLIGSLTVAVVVGGGIGFLLDDNDEETSAPSKQEEKVDEERQKMAEEAEGNSESSSSEDQGAEGEQGEAPAQDDETKVHTVVAGDTLYEISLEYYDSPQYQNYIAEVNNLASADDLQLGMTLKIPFPPKQVANKPQESSSSAVEASTIEATENEQGEKIHVVVKGDNLYRLSLQYYDTPAYQDFIATYNNLQNADSLELGQQIKIPPRPPQPE
ncbi:LysM peptidoglycan-binding domain-containing protein [Bacillus solimangrovi]|uniref:LysM domain-containing protein n=1 Tax=Bacillus solimangrovi TaxID=1305675 RepID=A0A1E5LEE9_9BACI|nr:LysM domain-containing protein [Bacillus solimangrovi]OEH92440.1 hypothetical protein BFG57_15780 [Bacillus solimangrovi]